MTQPPGYPPQQPPAGQAPSNNLVIAIIGLIFCLLPGIFAVVKASQVNGLWAQGQYAEAQASADAAKKWGIASIILGVILVVINIIIAVVGGMSASDQTAAMMAVMI